MRQIVSPLSGIRSPFGLRDSVAVIDAYAVGGFSPSLVFDFSEEFYRTNSTTTTFDDAMTFSRSGNATMVDSDGLLKWAPHNLLTYSEDFSNVAWAKQVSATVSSNAGAAPDGTITADRVTFGGAFSNVRQFLAFPAGQQITGRVWLKLESGNPNLTIGLSGSIETQSITVTSEWALYSVTATTDGTNVYGVMVQDRNSSGFGSVLVWGAHLYHSDLGGMASVPEDARATPSASTYVPTTSAARYLPRRGHHIYNGAEWVNEGVLVESEARTNLLLNSGTLATQNVTVTAVPHTLHFTGTGTVTLSGASTAGPLVGTGAGENNRVSLTFTPTAGTLTLTVTGTVTNADLEVGSTLSSHKPTSGSTVTRAADSNTSGELTYDSTAMWFTLLGAETYADLGAAGQVELFDWRADANNRITVTLDTDGAEVGEITLTVVSGGALWAVAADYLTPGINKPFSIAWRVTSSAINIAVGGSAATEVSTTSIPDLSSASTTLKGMGTRKLFRQGAGDVGDAGIEEASA